MENKIANYKFGCVMLQLDIPNWDEITSMIVYEDIYKPNDPEYSIQKFPHVTALYGLHSDIPDNQVTDIINKYKYIDLELKTSGISSFSNKDFDVIKFGIIKSNPLQEFHNELAKLPHTSDFPNFEPHITIAYLQPGRSISYIDPEFKLDFSLKAIRYSKTNGQKLFFGVY